MITQDKTIVISQSNGTSQGMDLIVHIDEVNKINFSSDGGCAIASFDSGFTRLALWQSYNFVQLWAKLRKDLKYQCKNESRPKFAKLAIAFEAALDKYENLEIDVKTKLHHFDATLTESEFKAV